MAVLLKCVTCGGAVSENAEKCPHCGEPSFVGTCRCKYCEGNGYTEGFAYGKPSNWQPRADENAYDIECSKVEDYGINKIDETCSIATLIDALSIENLRKLSDEYEKKHSYYSEDVYKYTYKKKCLHCNATGLVRAVYPQNSK